MTEPSEYALSILQGMDGNAEELKEHLAGGKDPNVWDYSSTPLITCC